MRAILAIARVQVLRIVRSRVALAGVLVAAGMAMMQIHFMVWARGDPARAQVQMAWQLLAIFSEIGIIAAALLGSWSMHAETRDRSWQALLTKPVRPGQIVFGKFAGVMAVLGALTLLVWCTAHALIAFGSGEYFPRLDLALALQLAGLALPVALSQCLSLRFHPAAAIVITVLFRRELLGAVLGSVTASQYPAWVLLGPVLALGGLESVAPAYDLFTMDTLSAAVTILWGHLGWTAVYGLTVTMFLLALSSFFVAYREPSKSV